MHGTSLVQNHVADAARVTFASVKKSGPHEESLLLLLF